jgi:murein DD-endopeptidase MepM/ murein hydrolase activator NlpD
LKDKKSNLKARLALIILTFVILCAFWVLFLRLEGEKPNIEAETPVTALRASQEISFTASDRKSGLRNILISLIKDGKEVTLYEEKFPGVLLSVGGSVNNTSFRVNIQPKELGMTDGKAILRTVVKDYSWRGWFHGNAALDEKEIIIDMQPPAIHILTKAHNISQGGAGLLIYRLSEPCPTSGVYIGEDYFPGHSGYFKDANILLCFFALDYKKDTENKIFAQATDSAGNSSKAGFPYYIKRKAFKRDTINISDNFLNWKIPEFESEISLGADASLKDKFIAVNQNLRQTSYQKVSEVVSKTDPVLYWEGHFLRLPESAPRAGFADHRTYKYNNEIIDNQVHLGVDLASLAHSPVPASNKGKVVLTESVGIYGKTVIIDHGFGLFSMYAHLSSISVNEGQIVLKGQNIGETGVTGLAGGDHLHFSMIVNKTFVNPIEWWDDIWIKNNISSKINDLSSSFM